MRHAAPWVVLVIGLGLVAAPWTRAESSRVNVGVQIIMPPRPDAQVPSPLEEALYAPPAAEGPSTRTAAPPVQRMATVIHDGRASTLLVTEIPLL